MSLSDPTAKMSKSAGESHYVGVMEAETSIRKKVRSAVTDMGLESGEAMSAGVANLFEVLELSTEATGKVQLVEELRADFAAGTLMYSKLKDSVFEQLMEILRPIQKRRAELEASGVVLDMLQSGANKARAIAAQTIDQVRSLVGLGTDTS
jgi:tryptophanyl-tRNA synthetase